MHHGDMMLMSPKQRDFSIDTYDQNIPLIDAASINFLSEANLMAC